MGLSTIDLVQSHLKFEDGGGGEMLRPYLLDSTKNKKTNAASQVNLGESHANPGLSSQF